MQKWYQEPLFHFLLIGTIIFYIGYKDEPKKEIQSQKHLIITKSDIDKLTLQWKREKNSLPSKKELNKLLEYYIEDEILYREALRMQLDKNEPDIKKILIDKLKYISDDSIKIDKIPEALLHHYFQEHKEKFIKRTSKRISFTQVYLNPKKHKNIEKIAQSILKKLHNKTIDTNITNLGDKFYTGNQFKNVDTKTLSKSFSRSFIRELFKLPVQQWSKPIKSGFGIHIIYVEEKREKKEVTFNDVKEQVKDEWLIEENYNAYKKLYKKLRKEYTVTIETNNSTDTQ